MSEHVRFVLRSLLRRRRLVATQLVLVVSGALALFSQLPRTYYAEARLVAEPNPVLSWLANPRRAVRSDDDSFRFASQTVMKRGNLVRLIDETRLMESWAASRGPLARLKDRAREALGGPASAEDRMESIVGLLEKRLYVRTEGHTITIGADWTDGPTACAIVETALRTLLDERRGMELASIEESISILERHLAESGGAMAAIAGEMRPAGGTKPAEGAVTDPPEGPGAGRVGNDDRVFWTGSRLRIVSTQQDRLSRRLWDARIELDGARAAFDRRYQVIEPPQVPRKAEGAGTAAILVASALAGLLLGAFTAAAAELRAAAIRHGARLPAGVFAIFLTGLTALTVCAPVVGHGSLAAAVAPVLGAAVVYAICAAPARMSGLVVLFLILALENPGDAGGRWHSPFYALGALLLANLNLSIPVPALRFTGLDVLMGLLVLVILCRRAVRSHVDQGDVAEARPMVWAAAVWLGSVLALWAYGLARGGDFRNSLWQCHQLLWLPLAYLVFRSALRGRQDHGALMRVVVGAACLKAGLALWIRLTVSHSLQALPTATSHGDSVLFACAFALVVALVVEDAVPGRGLAAGLVLVLLAAGMVANNRRLAWVEVAAALAVVAAAASATRLKRAALRAGVLSLPVLLLYCAVGWTSAFVGFKPVRLLRSLAESGTDVSTAMRDIENFNLLWTLRDHPLLGTGFGHEYVEKVKGMDISGIFAQYRFVPHNGILGLLAFGGVLGISGILLTPVVAVYLAARAHRFARSPADRAAALAVMASAVVYLIQCYGDMGFVSWTGVFTLAPAVAVAGKLASATGAWPGSDVPDLGAGGVAAGS